MTRAVWMAGAVALCPALLLADFSYKETTRLTGGAIMQMSRALGGLSKSMRKVGEPQVSSVYVKGNRMAHVGDTNAQVWDLDKETITDIDLEKKTYSVITFAQMREAMERAMAKAKERQPKEQAKPSDPQAEMNVKVDIQDTGKTKSIEGLTAKEVILTFIIEGKDKKSGETGQMQTMSSIWVTEKVPGHDEYMAFQKRMAEKMAAQYAQMAKMGPGMMTGLDPNMRDSMAKMAAEAEKLQGVHLRQVTKMGNNLDPRTAGDVTDPSTMPQGPTGGQVAEKAAGSAANSAAESAIRRSLPGGLGGLGGFGRRRKEKEPEPAPAQQQQAAQQNGVLMEMLMEMGQFSTGAVDGSRFEVPAGFQQVEHPMMKMR